MTNAAKQSLTMAMIHNSIAKNYFEAAKSEADGNRKNFLNICVLRNKATENDVLTKISNDENRDYFRKEILSSESDTLLYENIIIEMLHMNIEQREFCEKFIRAVRNDNEQVFIVQP